MAFAVGHEQTVTSLRIVFAKRSAIEARELTSIKNRSEIYQEEKNNGSS
jgi:hypothetical protein